MALLRCEIRSEALDQDTSVTVILPYDRPLAEQKKPCKVLYLYHGIKLNDTGWLRKTNIEAYVQDYGIAVIMPDAARSFYTDGISTPAYYTYIAKELPRLCTEMFNISTEREDTFVAGLSMGGYGALKVALREPERFCAGAGLSSVCDPVEFALSDMGGDHTQREAASIWGSNYSLAPEDNLISLARRAANLNEDLKPKLYICCGTEDPLHKHNTLLMDELKRLPLKVNYEEWAGEHDWKFWNEAIIKALKFFFD